jgi:hypothetical protein
MVPFEMSVDARMMLTRMSLIYEKERGSRIRMSRDDEVVMLINYAVDSINEEIHRQFELFRRLLTPLETKALAAQGANIYRGAVVNPEADEPPENGITPGVKMYRGNPVDLESGIAVPPASANAIPQGPAKGKRVYRGRVIED